MSTDFAVLPERCDHRESAVLALVAALRESGGRNRDNPLYRRGTGAPAGSRIVWRSVSSMCSDKCN